MLDKSRCDKKHQAKVKKTPIFAFFKINYGQAVHKKIKQNIFKPSRPYPGLLEIKNGKRKNKMDIISGMEISKKISILFRIYPKYG